MRAEGNPFFHALAALVAGLFHRCSNHELKTGVFLKVPQAAGRKQGRLIRLRRTEETEPHPAACPSASIHVAEAINKTQRSDFAALAASMDIYESERRSFARISGLDSYNVLVVLGADFQFGDRSRILVTF